MSEKRLKTPLEWLKEGYEKREEQKQENVEEVIKLKDGNIDLDNPFYILKKAYEESDRRRG